jgi:hypothetical protein
MGRPNPIYRLPRNAKAHAIDGHLDHPAQPNAAQARSGSARRSPMAFVLVSCRHYGLNSRPSTSLRHFSGWASPRHDSWPDGPSGSCQPAARQEGATADDNRGRRRPVRESGRQAEVAGAGGGGPRPPGRSWTRCGQCGVAAPRHELPGKRRRLLRRTVGRIPTSNASMCGDLGQGRRGYNG